MQDEKELVATNEAETNESEEVSQEVEPKKGIPQEHKDFINNIVKLFAEKNLTNFDAQIVSQVISHAGTSANFKEVLAIANEVIALYPGDDKLLLNVDLQVLGTKLNEAFNAMTFNKMELDSLTLEEA